MQMFFKLIIALILLNIPRELTASKDPVRGKSGMVASASGIASQVGVDILKRGVML
mgnify:CR=1 FL=1